MLKRSFIFFVVLLVLGPLSACGALKSGKAKYEKSQSGESLEVPEGLKEPEGQKVLKVPE